MFFTPVIQQFLKSRAGGCPPLYQDLIDIEPLLSKWVF